MREEGVHRQIPVGRESEVLAYPQPGCPPPAGMMQPERRARRKNGFVSAAAHALTALRLTLGPQGLFDEVEQQSTAAFAGCSFLLCPPLKTHFLDAIFPLSPPQLLRKRGVGKIQSQGTAQWLVSLGTPMDVYCIGQEQNKVTSISGFPKGFVCLRSWLLLYY